MYTHQYWRAIIPKFLQLIEQGDTCVCINLCTYMSINISVWNIGISHKLNVN